MDLPTQIGKYQLQKQIGQGGMAAVYQAQQINLDRTVAVKIMHGHLADTDDFVTRFVREAKSVAQLQHPHIVRVIDFDTAENSNPYMVMEYISGGNLREHIDQHGTIPTEDALKITAQMLDALSYAHAKEMVHRDIKPGNIMFMDETHTHAVLADFGIARILTDTKNMTATGTMVGTPAYMSPEAVRGEKVDERTDIYSLGIVLFEMLTGHTPYEAETAYGIITRQLQDPLPSPREFRADLPRSVETVLMTALAKDKDERYKTAVEFRTAVQKISNGQTPVPTYHQTAVAPAPDDTQIATESPVTQMNAGGATEIAPTPVPAASETAEAAPPAASQPNRTLIGGGIVLALAAVLLGWWVWGGGNDPAVVEQPTATLTAPAVAVVDDPTATPTAEPSNTPTPTATHTPTATSTPTITPSPTPPPQARRIGSVRLSGGSTDANTAVLTLNGVRQPPADTQYQAWMAVGDRIGPLLGPVTVQNGTANAQLTLPPGTLNQFDRVVITAETDENPSEPSGDILLSASLPGDLLPAVRQLLFESDGSDAGILTTADQQLALAIQHAGFSQESLAEGDLAGAKQHAEHTINILDGESGDAFGDRDGNGFAENPGDGTGVRVYLQNALDLYQSIPTADLASVAEARAWEAAAQSTTNALEMVTEAIDTAERIVVSDTADEAAEKEEESLAAVLQEIRVGRDINEDGVIGEWFAEGGLAAVPPLTRQAAAFVFQGELRTDARPRPDDRAGGAHIIATESGPQLQIEDLALPPLPDGFHYEVWATAADGPQTQLGRIDLTGLAPQFIRLPLPESFPTFLTGFVIGRDEDAEDEQPGEILYTADWPTDTVTAVRQLFVTGHENGFLPGLRSQIDLAAGHAQFSAEALAAGDLDAGKVHAEHVINILDGETGSAFGDRDGNGFAENPGNGYGVRRYLEDIAAESETIRRTMPATAERLFYADLLTDTINTNAGRVQNAISTAAQILAADAAAEAAAQSAELITVIDTLLTGADTDNNDRIEPLTAEGGIDTIPPFVWLSAAFDLRSADREQSRGPRPDRMTLLRNSAETETETAVDDFVVVNNFVCRIHTDDE